MPRITFGPVADVQGQEADEEEDCLRAPLPPLQPRREPLELSARARAGLLAIVAGLTGTAFLHGAARHSGTTLRASSSSLAVTDGLITKTEEVTAEHHPKYAKVKGDIETLWQRPVGDVKGIFFAAHGCCHQGPDYFSEVEPGGWKFNACAKTNLGQCLGLPEEVYFRRRALARGYVVVAVSGGDGLGSCWSPGESGRVRDAIEYVREAEKLPEDTPIFATGSSSGGYLLTPMAEPVSKGGVPNLKCIVPMVSTADATSRKVPTLHVYMTQDPMVSSAAHERYKAIKDAGIRSGEIGAKPMKVTADFLGKCLVKDLGAKVVEALKDGGIVDDQLYLKQDARMRTWVDPVKAVIGDHSDDTLVADKSCLSELMNVAWSFHEFTGEFTDKIVDFCEGKWDGTLDVDASHKK